MSGSGSQASIKPSTIMPLNDEQQEAMAAFRARLDSSPISYGTAESVDQRARRPDPARIPDDVTLRIEIAPPSTQPHPLLDTGALKAPERVPVYFYSLWNQAVDAANTRIIFFIHGGLNVTGHPTDEGFLQFYIQLLRACTSHSGGNLKYVLVAPSYRLATVPENTFPAALQDLVAAYDYVLDQGYHASNIVIAGDSAGGNHAVVLTHLVMQSNRAPPRAVVSIAPDAIRGCDRLSELAMANASTDILTIPMLERYAGWYVGDSGVPLTDPLMSPAFIPFAASWPRTLILVGTGDLLIDGSRELAKGLSVPKVAVELVEYDVPHGWWTLPHVFPEEFQDTVQRISSFVL